MPPKAKKAKQDDADFQKKRDAKAESKLKGNEEDDEEDKEDEADEDSDEKSENIDHKFRLHRSVNIYITLPSGDEEIILDYDMCFTDKQAYQNWKAQGEANEEFGELSPDPNNNPFKTKQENEEQDANEMGQQGFNIEKPLELEFKLSKLLSFIRKQGYPIDNSFISYFSVDFQVQINCGPDPISQAVVLNPSDLEINQNGECALQIIFAKGIKGDFYDTEIKQKEVNVEQMTPAELANQRNKERSIGFIIEKVTQWRKLYNGYYDEKQELKRMSLEDAANKVGVSKKSLDDYLSQIRLGRYNGFDFNKNKDQKVGKLRLFNKEIKKMMDDKQNQHTQFQQ